MRVSHFQYDDLRNPWVGGGGAVRAHEIYRRLADDHRVTVYTGAYPGARDETVDGVAYVRLGAATPYAWSRWTYARRATRVLAAGGYDAAVVDYSLYTPIALPASDRVALNFNLLMEDTVAQRFGRPAGVLLRSIERARIRRARTIGVMSRFLLERIRPRARPDAAFFVVGAGVGPDLFEVRRAEADYVLYYGRFDIFQKGIDRLFEAARLFLDDVAGVRLVLAGRGRDAGRVRTLAAAHPYADRISVEADIGPIRRAQLLGGARAVVMPSRFEGFGMVAAEAMAAGAPVIAARRDSLPEVVGDAGLLVDPEDPRDIARALTRLLGDDALRADLVRRGRERARRYSWSAVVDEQRALLRHLARTPDSS